MLRILAVAQPQGNLHRFCADFVQVRSVAEAWPQAFQVPPKRGERDLNSVWDNPVKPLLTV
jgi:hypothetical protein